MISRIAAGWQLILADLALILFLVTLAALASAIEEDEGEPNPFGTPVETIGAEPSTNAPVQALYRPTDGIIPFEEWISSQPNDPRAQLTIFATYSSSTGTEAWQKVRSMFSDAQSAGISARVIMAPAEREDIYASFAFDRNAQSTDGAQLTP